MFSWAYRGIKKIFVRLNITVSYTKTQFLIECLFEKVMSFIASGQRLG